MVAVYRVGLKTKPHLKKLRLADFFIMGQWSSWSFVLLVSWVVGKLPKTVCKRVDGICDASLASRDCTLSTGGAQES